MAQCGALALGWGVAVFFSSEGALDLTGVPLRGARRVQKLGYLNSLYSELGSWVLAPYI